MITYTCPLAYAVLVASCAWWPRQKTPFANHLLTLNRAYPDSWLRKALR